MSTLLILVFSIITILNLYATLVLWRCIVYSVRQRFLQSILIWLFPLLGAILVLSVAREVNAQGDWSNLNSNYASNEAVITSDNVGQGCDSRLGDSFMDCSTDIGGGDGNCAAD